MFTKFKNALINAVGGTESLDYVEHQKNNGTFKYEYSRPHFLKFSEEEINAASDTRVRPLILPRDIEFPFKAGYCECINAGKSKQNEDQGAYWTRTLSPKWWTSKKQRSLKHSNVSPVSSQPYDINHSSFTDLFQEGENSKNVTTDVGSGDTDNDPTLTYTVFSIFDGHGGPMVAVTAARELEEILHKKLEEVADLLLPNPDPDALESDTHHQKGGIKYQIDFRKPINPAQLIVGALECSFKEMDRRIGEDKENFKVKGGCTALVVLFILGKVYTACAGDSRAIVAVGNSVEALSRDHTPTSERARICHVGFQKPFLLKNDYTSIEYYKRPTIHDLGKPVLYRDPEGFGYSYRIIESEDLKMPLISGSGKRARLMGTIGVTRGFGDHELKALGSTLSIKPFLSPVPEIRILEISQLELTSVDVIIMASDGLFDVTTNKQAVTVVRNSFDKMTNSDSRKYMCSAQDLVNYARGKPTSARSWKKNDGDPASGDDITAWVIPLLPYQMEHNQWYLNLSSQNKENLRNCNFKFFIDLDNEKLPITGAEECLLSDNEDSNSVSYLQ